MATILTRAFWQSLLQTLTQTLRVFPREITLAAITTIATAIHTEMGSDAPTIYQRIALASVIAMNLSFALHIIRTAGRISRTVDIALWTLGTAGIGWVVSWIDFTIAPGIATYAYMVVAVHALVITSWCAFGSVELFWNANMRMLVRAIIALLFTNALQIGLSLAVIALRVLFSMQVLPNLEAHINISALLFVTSLLYFSGMRDISDLDAEPRVNKAMEIFVRWVLVPLITVFTAILWAYAIKLLGSELVPDVAYYVLWLNGCTIAAMLFSWPLRDASAFPWRHLHRWGLISQLPLLGIAVWAWGMHLQQDGISYDGFTTAAILSIACITSIATIVMRRFDIRIVPVLTLIIIGSTTIGPISVTSVAERSLTARGKQDQLKDWAPVGSSVYRSSTGKRFVQSVTIDSIWQGAFSIGNYNDSVVVDVRDTTGTVVRLAKGSTLVRVWSPVLRDTVTFDAAKCLLPDSEELRPLTFTSGTRTVSVMCTDLSLKRDPTDSAWSITLINAMVVVR